MDHPDLQEVADQIAELYPEWELHPRNRNLISCMNGRFDITLRYLSKNGRWTSEYRDLLNQSKRLYSGSKHETALKAFRSVANTIKRASLGAIESLDSTSPLERARAALSDLGVILEGSDEFTSDYIVGHIKDAGLAYTWDGGCTLCGGRKYHPRQLGHYDSDCTVGLTPCHLCNDGGHVWRVEARTDAEQAAYQIGFGASGFHERIGRDDSRWCPELEGADGGLRYRESFTPSGGEGLPMDPSFGNLQHDD